MFIYIYIYIYFIFVCFKMFYLVWNKEPQTAICYILCIMLKLISYLYCVQSAYSKAFQIFWKNNISTVKAIIKIYMA